MNDIKLETATFANGCFWCTEAIFKRLRGVSSVMPGYSGGKRQNPNYWQIHSGATGHAESIQIQFDPTIISYDKLLDIFWHTHNPTTLNRQNYDVGTEYRSAIFYHDEKQKDIAEKSKEELEKSGEFKDPIVTEISPYTGFYSAEEEHKDFYEKNRFSPYCMIIINPKIKKLIKDYSNVVKEKYK